LEHHRITTGTSWFETKLEIIRPALQQFLERAAREQYDDADLRGKLARISRGMIRDIGRIPYSVATRAYAQWLATDEQAAQRRLRLFSKALGLEEGSDNPLDPPSSRQAA
jgi:hypothetical protein